MRGLKKRRGGVLIVMWQGYHGRSAALSKELHAEVAFVATGTFRKISTAPLRYALQSAHTLWLLLQKRPQTVIVVAPPLPLVALAWIVSKLLGARLLIDAHTGVFNDPRWDWALKPFLWFARRSELTIVTN